MGAIITNPLIPAENAKQNFLWVQRKYISLHTFGHFFNLIFMLRNQTLFLIYGFAFFFSDLLIVVQFRIIHLFLLISYCSIILFVVFSNFTKLWVMRKNVRKVFSFEIFLPFCKLYPPSFCKRQGIAKEDISYKVSLVYIRFKMSTLFRWFPFALIFLFHLTLGSSFAIFPYPMPEKGKYEIEVTLKLC